MLHILVWRSNWNGFLNNSDTIKLLCVEFRRPLIDPNGIVRFNKMILQNANDLRTIFFFVFAQYHFKGLIRLDTTLVRSIHNIQESLFRPRIVKNIMECRVPPDEENMLSCDSATSFWLIHDIYLLLTFSL